MQLNLKDADGKNDIMVEADFGGVVSGEEENPIFKILIPTSSRRSGLG